MVPLRSLSLVLLFLCTQSVLLHVNKQVSSPFPDGSEAQPYASLQSAFAAALTQGGGQVSLAPGSDTYSTESISSVPVPITLFLNGNEITVDTGIGVTGGFVLEGPGKVRGTAGFTINGPVGSVEVREKVTITKMISTAFTLSGGIFTVNDCDVTSNTGYFTLISSQNSYLSVSNSRFSSNSASLFQLQSSDQPSDFRVFTFKNCDFRDNGSFFSSQPIVINFASSTGSGLLQAKVTGCTFVNNYPTTIAVARMTVVLENSKFSEEGSSITLSNMLGSVQINNCQFSQTVAAIQIADSSSESTISGCSFTSCSISVVVRSSSHIQVTNSEFTHNNNNLNDPLMAQAAAGFTALQVDSVRVENSVFAYNSAANSPSIMIVQAGKVVDIIGITVANTTSQQMGAMVLLASNTQITNSLFSNITSVDVITAFYGSQVRLDYSTVVNINALTGSFYGSNFSEFSSAYTTYRNVTCGLQLIRAHVLFSPVALNYDVFEDVVASYILANEFQGGVFRGCTFNLSRPESSDMIITTVTGQPVNFYDNVVTGYFGLLLDAESTEGSIVVNNLTVRNARSSGLFSSLQYSITLGNSSFDHFEIRNATLNQIALA